MSLQREYTMTINKETSVLNKNLTISTNDQGIDIIFRLIDCPYIKLSLKQNLYARIILLDPLGKQIDSDVTSIVENRVLFKLTKKLMANITETGVYKLYIAIMDDKSNVNLLPPIKCTIEESEIEVRGLSVGLVNQSSIDNSLNTDYGNEIALFNADGSYNRTVWLSGDMITTARMNKLEDATSILRDEILNLMRGVNTLNKKATDKVLAGSEHEPLIISNLPKGFYKMSGYIKDFPNKNSYSLLGENYFIVTYSDDKYSRIIRCLNNEEKFVKYKYDKILEIIYRDEQELVVCEQAEGYIRVTLDEYQYIELNENKKVILPKPDSFTEIKLYVNAKQSDDLNLDGVIWIGQSELVLDELNTIYLTYINGKWYGSVNSYKDASDGNTPPNGGNTGGNTGGSTGGTTQTDNNYTDQDKAKVNKIGSGTLMTTSQNLIGAVNELETTKVDAVPGKSLVLDTEITKIHDHANDQALNLITLEKIQQWDRNSVSIEPVSHVCRETLLPSNKEVQLTSTPIQDLTLHSDCVIKIPTTLDEKNITLNVTCANDLTLTFSQGINTHVLNLKAGTMNIFNINFNSKDSTIVRIHCIEGVVNSGIEIVEKYSITNNLSNCVTNNNTKIISKGSSYNATLSVNSNYSLSNVSIYMGGINITNTVCTYQNSDAIINIPNVTGNIVIVAEGTLIEQSREYSITNNLSNCTTNNSIRTINEGSSYSAIITPNNGYELMNLSIAMGGINVTNSVYTYQNGRAIINIPNVTGNVVVTVQCVLSSGAPTTYSININIPNCTSSNTNTNVTEGSSYSTLITPNDGYQIDRITVTMNGTDITSDVVTDE